MTDEPTEPGLPPSADFDPRYFDGGSDWDEQDLLTTTIARQRLVRGVERARQRLVELAGDGGQEAAQLRGRIRALEEAIDRLDH